MKAVISILILAGSLIGQVYGDIIVNTDTTDEFSGTFVFDVTAGGAGWAKFTSPFPHLSNDGAGYGQFQVNLGTGGLIDLTGYDFSYSIPVASENFPAGVPSTSRIGTFTSFSDGISTIQYEYTNIDTSNVITTGRFKYSVIPEPATIGLVSLTGIALLINRKIFSA